jgi:hypothetical protein
MGKKNPKHNKKKSTLQDKYRNIEKRATKLLKNNNLENIENDIIKKTQKYKILTKNNLSKDSFELFKLAGDLLNAEILSAEQSIMLMEQFNMSNQTQQIQKYSDFVHLRMKEYLQHMKSMKNRLIGYEEFEEKRILKKTIEKLRDFMISILGDDETPKIDEFNYSNLKEFGIKQKTTEEMVIFGIKIIGWKDNDDESKTEEEEIQPSTSNENKDPSIIVVKNKSINQNNYENQLIKYFDEKEPKAKLIKSDVFKQLKDYIKRNWIIVIGDTPKIQLLENSVYPPNTKENGNFQATFITKPYHNAIYFGKKTDQLKKYLDLSDVEFSNLKILILDKNESEMVFFGSIKELIDTVIDYTKKTAF